MNEILDLARTGFLEAIAANEMGIAGREIVAGLPGGFGAIGAIDAVDSRRSHVENV